MSPISDLLVFCGAKLSTEIYVVGFSLLLPIILWLGSAILYTWKWMMTSLKNFCLVFLVDILFISLKYWRGMSVTYDVVLDLNKWKVKNWFVSKMNVKQQNYGKGIFTISLGRIVAVYQFPDSVSCIGYACSVLLVTTDISVGCDTQSTWKLQLQWS